MDDNIHKHYRTEKTIKNNKPLISQYMSQIQKLRGMVTAFLTWDIAMPTAHYEAAPWLKYSQYPFY